MLNVTIALIGFICFVVNQRTVKSGTWIMSLCGSVACATMIAMMEAASLMAM